jgi:octaprenyl-diphosphate synthase
MTTRPAPTPADFAAVFVRLHPHLAALNELLRHEITAFEPEIRAMADACIDTSGKRIRPALVFLSGWRDDAVSADLVKVAAVIEMVHLATLVHDDIMDEAEVRRARPTAARRFGPEAAVLLGDALFAHALHLAASFPTTEVCAAVSAATRKVCTGEIIQTLRRRTAGVSREDYYRVIGLKTAELFRVSCQLGARLGGGSAEFVAAATSFGRGLGIAYQIYDDLADFFGDEQRIGKTLGTDLASGKFTLPLFILRDRLAEAEAAALTAELTGKSSPDLARRLAQMRELDVFAAVEAALGEELAAAENSLLSLEETPAVPLLLSLGQALREQVAKLRPA